MQFGLESLGRWTDPVETVIERDGTIAYAAATNDPIAAHLAGDQAPPIYAVVPVWGTMSTAMMDVVPPDALAFVVHGEQDMRFHRPITPGLTLRSRAAAVGVHVKPNGTTVVVKVESRDAADDLHGRVHLPVVERRERRELHLRESDRRDLVHPDRRVRGRGRGVAARRGDPVTTSRP